MENVGKGSVSWDDEVSILRGIIDIRPTENKEIEACIHHYSRISRKFRNQGETNKTMTEIVLPLKYCLDNWGVSISL